METLLMVLLSFTAIFLILIVLVQRGRGGGLAGALAASKPYGHDEERKRSVAGLAETFKKIAFEKRTSS